MPLSSGLLLHLFIVISAQQTDGLKCLAGVTASEKTRGVDVKPLAEKICGNGATKCFSLACDGGNVNFYGCVEPALNHQSRNPKVEVSQCQSYKTTCGMKNSDECKECQGDNCNRGTEGTLTVMLLCTQFVLRWI